MGIIGDKLKDWNFWKGVVSIVAAILMYYTPDYIDQIIESVLLALGGIDILRIEKKKP